MYLVNHLLDSFIPPNERDERPSTIVLRPNGCLSGLSCETFQEALESALEWTTDTVVVDMLWVESVPAEGISSLMAGLERATALGKTLSLRSLDVDTHATLEAWLAEV
ncbi:MAG: hypothetical protein LRZ84_21550 [Desertifilum sp.]|nr:hypothetical protein [Desertifilum sp.]